MSRSQLFVRAKSEFAMTGLSVLGGVVIYVGLLVGGMSLVIWVDERIMEDISDPQRQMLVYADFMVKGAIGGLFTIAGVAVNHFFVKLRRDT